MVAQWSTVAFVVLDAVCFVSCLSVISLLYFRGQSYKRGFYCDDNSIKYHYKDDTVSAVVVIIVSAAFTIAAVLLVETLQLCTNGSKSNVKVSLKNSKRSLCIAVRVLLHFFTGLVITMTVTDIGKYCVGRLRPHFLSVCEPDWSKFNCTDMVNQNMIFVYITEPYCQGTNAARLKDARLSFPSGHTSFAVFSAVFFSVYLQYRLKVRRSLLLVKFLQLVVLALALLCGLSRISDHKHHWSDVLAGAVLGAAMAIWFTGPIRSKKLDESHDEATTAAGV